MRAVVEGTKEIKLVDAFGKLDRGQVKTTE